ncbi:L,D-transpeptidase family protein [Parvibaculaceae bacterium PLY_AMNH_Bact1]|nr:L,D-transpeptidase family protein [Parvibaculaceae bacterium PLY_AMNH_Bact1]
MKIFVRGKPGASTGTLTFNGETLPCALGRSGIISIEQKKEGDGATPAGSWPLRRVLYRPDRLSDPETNLVTKPITHADGWCDDPTDPHYNEPIELPYAASAESLWREDELYNICVVLGHNDDPVVPHKGSAIFFHVAKEKDGELCATEGCVALPQHEIVRVLMNCGQDTVVEIELDD